MISVTAVNNRLYNYGNSLTKIKRWCNFTHDGLLAYILLHMRGEIYIPVLIGLYKCNYYLIFP